MRDKNFPFLDKSEMDITCERSRSGFGIYGISCHFFNPNPCICFYNNSYKDVSFPSLKGISCLGQEIVHSFNAFIYPIKPYTI